LDQPFEGVVVGRLQAHFLREFLHFDIVLERGADGVERHRRGVDQPGQKLERGVLKRDVRAEEEAISDWRLRAGELSEYGFENLIRMFEYYDRWGLIGNPNVLRWLLKREPASLESFIRQSLKERDDIH
jgi:hypothetical protein